MNDIKKRKLYYQGYTIKVILSRLYYQDENQRTNWKKAQKSQTGFTRIAMIAEYYWK